MEIKFKKIRTENIDLKNVITKSQYARIKGFSPSAIEKWVKAGKVEIVILGSNETNTRREAIYYTGEEKPKL